MSRKSVDWDAVEPIYRAGIRSLRDIASEFDVAESAIRKRALKFDWTRDLSARIKSKADDLVRTAEVRNAVRKETSSKLSERDIINANAETQAQVLLTERADIKRLSALSEKLELELEFCDDDLDKKARIIKSLTETRKIIIELRRRNYGINDNSNGDSDKPPVEIDDKTLAAKLAGIFALAEARKNA